MINGDTIIVSDSTDRQSRVVQTTIFECIEKTSVADLRVDFQQTARLHPLSLADHHGAADSMSKTPKNDLSGKTMSPMEQKIGADGKSAMLVVHKGNDERQLGLPADWKEREKHSKPGCLYAEYQAPDSADSRFVYWNRGYGGNKLSRDSAVAFKDVLAKPPHVLSQQEARSVRAVLANGVMKNEGCFEITPGGLRTESLDGRTRVLVLDAVWPESGMHSHGIFADFDGSGQYVEQAYLIAPEKDFGKQLQACKESLHSLKWK